MARRLLRLPFVQFHRLNRGMSTLTDLHCEIDAEPLTRYRTGGYHPVHLGDQLNSGRYKILHKLGWGGYSTVWLATDRQLQRLVAVKVLVSELGSDYQEAIISRNLAAGSSDHPGKRHVAQLIDSFDVVGPNGTHDCLVTELLGASMQLAAEDYRDERLPGDVAWQVVRQVAQAVAYMHDMGVVHGDLHTGNIAFVDDSMTLLSENDAIRLLGRPQTSEVQIAYGRSMSSQVPKYLVQPSNLPTPSKTGLDITIKLIDYGSAFCTGQPSPKMRCPLPFRAPEAVLTKHWDGQADMWSLACTIFALIVGYPPFDSLLLNESELISQWVATFGDLPQEWEDSISTHSLEAANLETSDFHEWLRETYHDNEKQPFFTELELEAVNEMLLSLLRYRPAERPTSPELTRHPLFDTDAFANRKQSHAP